MSDVLLLSGISRLSFDFTFLSPFLFFYQILLLFLSCHFLLRVHSPVLQKILHYFLLRDGLFC